MKQNYLKKIVKNFDSIVEKTLFKLQDKTNYFYKKYGQIKYFYKLLIGFFSISFFYLLYLSIPSFYDKTWVQTTVENKLIEDFKIDFSVSANITYNILPSPNFLIKDVKIFTNNNSNKKSISEIKKLRVFIDQKKFFNKEFKISRVAIYDANFSLQGDDLILLNKASHKKFSNKKIKIYNGNIFLKDNENQTIAITKVKLASLYFDDLKKVNLLNLDGEIFNIPFNFNLSKDDSSGIKESNLIMKKLKIKINDKSSETPDGLVNGVNTFLFLNSNIQTKYNKKGKLISFEFDGSKIKNNNTYFKGRLLLEPFELKLDIDLKRYDLFRLLDLNSIIGELIKSKLLFNKKLSTNISIDIASNFDREIFSSSEIKFNIVNGKINFDKTKLINDKIGILEIDNSHLFFDEDNFVLSSDIIIDIKNSDKLFSFFQTSKKLRKPIKKIIINFDYDLTRNQIDIKNIKIDGAESNDEMFKIMREISSIQKHNLNKSRIIFNNLFSAHSG
jgi:hypothetical protein